MAEKIKLTFLGTGSAIPTSRRNHPAVLLQYKDENILVDCGEGTQRQFRKARINPCKLTRILITHWHGDHVLGLPGLFQTMMLNSYNGTLEIYGPKGTKKKLELYLDLFSHKGDEIKISVHEISEGIIFENEEFFIESAAMEHDSPSNAYSFVLKEKTRLDKEKLSKLRLPSSPLINELAKGKKVEINGKKIDGKKLVYTEPAKKITWILDTRKNQNAIKIAKDSDILICESTYSKDESELANNYAHLTSEDAATIAKKANVNRLILMHLSQRYEGIPKVILEEAKKIFKEASIVEDFDQLEL